MSNSLDVNLSLTLPSSSPNPKITSKLDEQGIRLIQLLLQCAKHVSSANLHRADVCLSEIMKMSSVTGDPMQRLGAYFARALSVKLLKRWPGVYKALKHTQHGQLDLGHDKAIFAQSFPWFDFIYTIITQTILHATAEERIVHVIDLGSSNSNLWLLLLNELARVNPQDPPCFKLTCINTNKALLDELEHNLTKEAEKSNIPFQFNPINVALKELTHDMLKVQPEEALAFVSILNLHVLLAEDDRVDNFQFGSENINHDSIKISKQLSDFLSMLRSLSPKLLFLLEQEANHNGVRLIDRFMEALHYYSAIFDSIDATCGSDPKRLILEEMFGGEIQNIVGCEGSERFERHERYGKWLIRVSQSGFRPIRLWFNFEEDWEKLVDNGIGKFDGFKIVKEKTSLMICWHQRPLFALTAWTS